MIILDPADAADSKHGHGHLPAFPEKSYSRLPDYETSQAAQQVNIITSLPIPPSSTVKKRWYWLNPRWRRILFWTLGIYTFLTLAIGIPARILTKRQANRLHSPSPPTMKQNWDNDDSSGAVDTSQTILQVLSRGPCRNFADGTALKRSFTTNHTFPAPGMFSVYSTSCDGQGRLAANFTIDINPDQTQRDVLLSMDFSSSSDAVGDSTAYCFVDDGADRGLWMNLPMQLNGSDWMNIDINLLLPAHISQLDQLSINLPNFSQVFSDLSSVHFNSFAAGGYSSPVKAKSLVGDSIVIKSSLAEIIGNFTVSRALSLATIGGPVHVNVTLGLETTLTTVMPGKRADLQIATGNSDIHVNVHLLDEPDPKQSVPPVFSACLETFNAPIFANITTSHLATNISRPTPLWIKVQNNVGLSNVTLDSDLEFQFDLETKLSQVRLFEAASSQNNRNMERNYRYDIASPTKIVGHVSKGAVPAGGLSVSSILGDIVVHFQNYT